MTELNSLAKQFLEDLSASRSYQNAKLHSAAHQPSVHVVGAGATLTAAYEQLRNAAEYAEEHVLLQRAIRRFYRRLFVIRDKHLIEKSGEDLIIELTHAGYIANDSIAESDVQVLSELAKEYYSAYEALHKIHGIGVQQTDQWTYELLAVEIESLINTNSDTQAFVQFAQSYFSTTIDFESVFDSKPDGLEISLFAAIHKALLKSDDAVIRYGILQRFSQRPSIIDPFVETNKQIDTFLQSPVTEKLFRLIDRRGAPLRVLRHMVDEQPDFETLILQREHMLHAYEKQVTNDYYAVNKKINSGVIKSVVFLIITKFIIGIAIEVPYDYLVFGMILWLPLIINLLFPPLYMILLRFTMVLPGYANTKRLVEQIDSIFYNDSQPKLLVKRPSREFGTGYNVLYGVVFAAVFGGVAFLLWKFFGFDLMHLLIFFTFLSAASFLGFRLSRTIRELESVETYQNGVTLIRDFLYMPFVVVGRYISDKYSRVNVVALVLDMLIELPLKTILRLVRQWAAFISTKKDEL